jgi:hypothetical protein
MKRSLLLAGIISALGCLAALARAADEPKASPEKATEAKFIRLTRDAERRPQVMETAVVRYLPGDKLLADKSSAARPNVEIDLVGAVHVGDRAYYDELNRLFEKYDVVLYELVAPEGTRVPKGGRKGPSTHPIGAMQDGMSSVLELAHQLNCVDYTKKNFVHADMSPEDFAKTMEERGESFFQIFLRLMGTGMAQSASGAGMSDSALLMALFSKDRAMVLKTIMAEQFESLEGSMSALDGPGGSTIITERNKRCFEVLDKQLAAGKKRIAIFYGAGHLPDMERRLIADYGLKRTSETWLPAWQLQPKKDNEPAGASNAKPADSSTLKPAAEGPAK